MYKLSFPLGKIKQLVNMGVTAFIRQVSQSGVPLYSCYFTFFPNTDKPLLKWPPFYNAHLSTTANSLKCPLFCSSRWSMHSLLFQPHTTLTPPQHQWPLRSIPTVKITSQQWPVNQQLTNSAYKPPFLLLVKGDKHPSILHVIAWSLFLCY